MNNQQCNKQRWCYAILFTPFFFSCSDNNNSFVKKNVSEQAEIVSYKIISYKAILNPQSRGTIYFYYGNRNNSIKDSFYNLTSDQYSATLQMLKDTAVEFYKPGNELILKK